MESIKNKFIKQKLISAVIVICIIILISQIAHAEETTSTGDLDFYVKNADEDYISGAVVVRYNSDWKVLDDRTTDANGKATWINLDTGTYSFEFYYNGEYLGTKKVTINQSYQNCSCKYPEHAQYIDNKLVKIIDNMESTADWTTFTSDGSSINTATVPGRTNNAFKITYNLKNEGWVVISKNINPEILYKIQGIRFYYRGTGEPNTIEAKLANADENNNNITMFAFLKNRATAKGEWTAEVVPINEFKCMWPQEICDNDPELDINKVRIMEFAVSNKPGDTQGSGTLIIDDVQGIMSLSCVCETKKIKNKDNGEPCDSDSECKSNYCEGNVCNSAPPPPPPPPLFNLKARDASQDNPGALIAQITNIINNPDVEGQIILSIPDNIEVHDIIGGSAGKAAYTVTYDAPAGGAKYIEIQFDSKSCGDYRFSATLYWHWKGDSEIHQIGFDKTVYVCPVKECAGKYCPPEEECIENKCSEKPKIDSNLILLIAVVFLGLVGIIAVLKMKGENNSKKDGKNKDKNEITAVKIKEKSKDNFTIEVKKKSKNNNI